MLQTNIREGYEITTLEVVELVEDLISYLAVAKYIRLRNAQIPKVFYKAAAGTIWTMMLAKVRYNTLTLILSKTAQRRSLSVVSNRSTALITDKFGVALLTEPAILNDANVALVDAMHYSVVIDALTITLIKDDDDLLGTVNSYIKLRRLGARCKTEAADSRYAKASGGRTKKDKDLEDSDTGSDVLRLRRRDRAAACARSAERKQLGKKAQLKKTRDEEELAKAKKEKEEKELIDAYILYFKELLSNNSGIFANAIGMGKTRAIVLATEVQNARVEGNVTEYNAVNDNNKLCPTEGERTFYCADLLALQFCFFSNSPPENIGRLTKEEVIEMRIDTTDAIFKALAAANKLFVIVCGFGKVDKHVFRAYNTISVTAQRTIIRKGGPYIEKRVILLLGYVTIWGRTIFDEFYNCKSEGIIIANCLCLDFLSIVQNAEQQCRDILEKEGLNELEASRRVIFNCFEMQAIASYSALTTLKAAYVKDLFTNLSKDYFLVREARAITKSSLKFQNLLNLCSESIAAEDAAKAANTLLLLKEVCAKILIESYKLIKFGDESVLVMQRGMIQDLDRPWIIVALIAFAEVIILTEATHVLAEMCVSIVYFNLDSELELKVLSGGSTVTDQRID
ncbi:hypothetical protein HBI76_153530 [Parastagonospora nodorum]|nr:hypothetical protein HBI76_153530 [Parastagonospora nodorum]